MGPINSWLFLWWCHVEVCILVCECVYSQKKRGEEIWWGRNVMSMNVWWWVMSDGEKAYDIMKIEEQWLPNVYFVLGSPKLLSFAFCFFTLSSWIAFVRVRAKDQIQSALSAAFPCLANGKPCRDLQIGRI